MPRTCSSVMWSKLISNPLSCPVANSSVWVHLQCICPGNGVNIRLSSGYTLVIRQEWRLFKKQFLHSLGTVLFAIDME